MTDTVPIPLEPASSAFASGLSTSLPTSATAPTAAPIREVGHTIGITFGGSGSEYFRIWAVNLLLTLVTLGIYLPWAKVRKLRYFYGNTQVGDHPLDFHGDPKRMLRGFVLVGAMMLLYSVAGKVSPTAGLVAFVIVAAVWPALFRAGQQFRLANTSWRGLRFRFNGDLKGAYRAMLPFFAPGLVLLGIVALGGQEREPGSSLRTADIVGVLALLAVLVLFPMLMWLLKKYQHGHFVLGQVQTEMRSGPWPFYAIALKTMGLALAMGCLLGIVVALGSFSALVAGVKDQSPKAIAFAIFAVVAVTYLVILAILIPYSTARAQNLVWGATQCAELRFESTLRFRPLLVLTLKNWLLMLVTLGLYWPFAKVAMTRIRLEAVTVHSLLPPDELVSSVRATASDATGDAAGDLFGFDIGW